MTLFEIENNRQKVAPFVTKLVETRAIDCDDLIRNTNVVPASGGLYVFSVKKRASVKKYLYAGKSDNLRARIGNQHLVANDRSIMLRMVMQEEKLEKQGAMLWIRNNCRLQWVLVEDTELRAFAEDYTIAVLQPMWNHRIAKGLSSRRQPAL